MLGLAFLPNGNLATVNLARLISFGLPLCACGEVLRLEDYAVAESDASEPVGTAALPLLPAQPDDVGDRREACARCVEDNCRTEREVCIASERCREMLACTGPSEESSGCSDPNCLAQCVTDHPHSPYFHAYFTCAFGDGLFPTPTEAKCAAECGGGANWDCVGNFSWDAPSGEPARVYATSILGVLSETATPYPGFLLIEASVCSDRLPTPGVDPPWTTGCTDWKSVDPFDGVALDFGSVPPAVAFRSVDPLLGPGGPYLGAPHRTYPWPVARSGPLWVSMLDGNTSEAVASTLGWEPALGVLLVGQYDCLGTPGSTDIEIPGAVRWTEEGRPPDTAWETHLPDLSGSNPALRYAINSFFVNVRPTQALTITSFLDDGATPISQRGVLVASASFTEATLYPMSQQEAGRR